MSGLVVEYSTLQTAASSIGTTVSYVLCDSLNADESIFESAAVAPAFAGARSIHVAYAAALSAQIAGLAQGIDNAAAAYAATDSALAGG